MTTPPSVSGRELYELLPTVYRVKDEGGDLARYLDAFGLLLDRFRSTLEQRFADGFPASPPGAMPAQSWLLPYFADLLDVHLISPRVDGRRGEVARAIAWRQRKGTLAALEEIAETVGGFEVEVQEGWRRVAVTPRLDQPVLPAAAYGEASEPDSNNPLLARRHPALPAVTPDVTLPSRAVATDESHPLAHVTSFGGTRVAWRQLDPHGVPCFPGSFEDASRRTPDVRAGAVAQGTIHPRRLLLFVPPPAGFFPPGAQRIAWGDRTDHPDYVLDSGGDPRTVVNPSRLPGSPVAPASVVITTNTPIFTEQKTVLEDLVFENLLHVSAGRIRLERVAAKELVVDTADVDQPVIEAVDCLFDTVTAKDGLVRLEGTTVMKSLACARLQASDCLFAGSLEVTGDDPGRRSCVRFSRVPPGFVAAHPAGLQRIALTTAAPIFFAFDFCPGGSADPEPNAAFGTIGYGTLHPASPSAVTSGAEDGGEMGADHHRATCLARAAVLVKLETFLPLGIEAVLVPDPRLLVEPPRISP